MQLTEQDIKRFHDFATARIASGQQPLTWRRLFEDWLLEHPTEDERREIDAIIRQGVEDIDAGRCRPAEVVHDELRQKHKLA